MAQTFRGKKGMGDVWRVDQVYTKIILDFHKKTEIHPCVLRRSSSALQGAVEGGNSICTNMREQKNFVKITVSKHFIFMGQLLVSQEKERENWLFSKLVVVGHRFPTDTSEYSKHYSPIS